MPRPAPAGEQRAGVQLDLGQGPAAGDTLVAAALKILTQPCSDVKAAWTQAAAQLWRDGLLHPPEVDAQNVLAMAVPDTPARDAKVLLRHPVMRPSVIRLSALPAYMLPAPVPRRSHVCKSDDASASYKGYSSTITMLPMCRSQLPKRRALHGFSESTVNARILRDVAPPIELRHLA